MKKLQLLLLLTVQVTVRINYNYKVSVCIAIITNVDIHEHFSSDIPIRNNRKVNILLFTVLIYKKLT